jgi:hypothetical protein
VIHVGILRAGCAAAATHQIAIDVHSMHIHCDRSPIGIHRDLVRGIALEPNLDPVARIRDVILKQLHTLTLLAAGRDDVHASIMIKIATRRGPRAVNERAEMPCHVLEMEVAIGAFVDVHP